LDARSAPRRGEAQGWAESIPASPPYTEARIVNPTSGLFLCHRIIKAGVRTRKRVRQNGRTAVLDARSAPRRGEAQGWAESIPASSPPCDKARTAFPHPGFLCRKPARHSEKREPSTQTWIPGLRSPQPGTKPPGSDRIRPDLCRLSYRLSLPVIPANAGIQKAQKSIPSPAPHPPL